MKEWIMKLCPEIADWKAELIAEAAHNQVLDEREACAELLDEMAEKDKLSNYYRVAALAIRERGAP